MLSHSETIADLKLVFLTNQQSFSYFTVKNRIACTYYLELIFIEIMATCVTCLQMLTWRVIDIQYAVPIFDINYIDASIQ